MQSFRLLRRGAVTVAVDGYRTCLGDSKAIHNTKHYESSYRPTNLLI
jgi:hypothetical protein